jgi:LmbE family N-acetylglucosaminyl deacetylase
MKHKLLAPVLLAVLLAPPTFLAGLAAVPLAASPGPDLETELQRLPRLGTIAYITAHPDDESGPIITYLARGLHARVVILSLTRGEGGQNLEGPELGEELGEVRTQEFARVVAGYGAEVRFLGAEDFGYSRSVEETLEIWDEEKILGELVKEIRALRPLVVISNWTGTPDDGSAHHEAAGLLARHAFGLAGEPTAFPEQFEQGYEPWQPRYLLVRRWSAEEEDELTFEVPVDEPSPVPGKTYQELGWEAFQEHRSQGMHLIQFPRRWRHLLRVEATLRYGPPAPTSATELVPDLAALPDLFPSLVGLQEWRERLAQVVSLAEQARVLVGEEKDSEAALALVQGAGLLTALRREITEDAADREASSVRALLDERQNQFLHAAATLAGVVLDAITDRAAVTPGERIWVGLAVRVSAPDVFRAAGFRADALRLETPAGWHVEPLGAEATGDEKRAEFMVSIPENLDPRRVAPAPLGARAALTTGSLRLGLAEPVRGLSRAPGKRPGLLEQFDPRRLLRLNQPGAEEAKAQLEPVNVTPAVTLRPTPRLHLLPASPGEMTREWCIELEAHRPQVGMMSAWFDVPVGWYTPLPKETRLDQVGQQATLCFPLTLPGKIPPDRYHLDAVAGRGIKTYELTRELRFAGTNDSTYRYAPAQAALEILDVSVPAGLRVGFIGFNNDPKPALLAQLGVGVDLLDERALARAPEASGLQDYDAIVVADRAYDYREDLAEANPRLLDYVKAGGTLVVEHQGRRWDPERFAPFPATKSSNRTLRVTDETAPVGVLVPDNPLLNFPNRIGGDDWADWVQERGLYFWESWSDSYTPLLLMADPGEEPLRGSLLYARYGEGVYIYSGLALFRQVEAGVPGGVRLYINLLSQRRVPRAEEPPGETSSE